MGAHQDSAQTIRQQIAALLLYQGIFQTDVGLAFLALLERLSEGDRTACLQAYGQWFQQLAARRQSWSAYLRNTILTTVNPFTQQAQAHNLADLPDPLIAAARHDLRGLQQIYACTGEWLSQWVQACADLPETPVVWPDDARSPLETKFDQAEDWAELIGVLADHYRQDGTGLFAHYRAFRWQQGQLVGVNHPDPVRLDQLVGYEGPQQALVRNTEFLLAGYPALHVLLYGSRGSGKSSRVKALVNEYGDRGLRLIEVAKSDLQDLSVIVEQLRDLPQKFIVFVDDLSFEDDDDTFKALKVVLEGSITARPPNVVVYATSNRRHLVREFFGDRPRPSQGDEIHAWDTLQEKLSFGDRFGLTLTFEPADQDTYLAIVHHLAAQENLAIAPDDLRARALQWATRHNGRSGRTARQFVDFLQGELALSQPD